MPQPAGAIALLVRAFTARTIHGIGIEVSSLYIYNALTPHSLHQRRDKISTISRAVLSEGRLSPMIRHTLS